MKNHIPLVMHESEAALAHAVKKTRNDVLKTRLKALLLRTRGHTPQDIAGRLLVSDRSVTYWVNLYNEGGVKGLSPKPSGRAEGNPKWDADIFSALAKEIDGGGYWSIPRMQEWITGTYAVVIPEQTVWYRMDQLKYSYKGARPHPAQGSKEAQEAFKKGGSSRSSRR